MEGLHFIRRTPILLAAISLDLFAVLFGGAIALLPVIAETRLHVGDVAYGWLRAAPGIGAALMALVLASRPVTRRVGRTLLLVVGIFGVATVVLGVTTSYLVAFIALVVLAGADMISVFIRSTLLTTRTPPEMLGRVMSVNGIFVGSSNEIGAFESGVTARWFGAVTSVILGGVLTLGTVRIPLEVKYQRRIDPLRDTEGMRTFMEKAVNNAPFGLLITQSPVTLADPRIIPVPLSTLLLLR